MADPLLNTLCSICHISTPKYTCPGCSSHTCSLACNRKHKSWANCSGRRDPTAYVPVSKLKTPAGVDHDYNFLSAIERERERNQREVVEEKNLFSERDLRWGLDDPYSFRKQWFGEHVRFHPVSAGARPRTFGSYGEDSDGEGEGATKNNDSIGDNNNRKNMPAKASQLVRIIRQRLVEEDVEVLEMPVGMTRQRENTTGWNRRTRRINWCVEWLVYGEGAEPEEELRNHTRVRHKALETMPLYKALGDSMAWYRKGQETDCDGDGDDDTAAEDDDEVELAQAAGRRRRRHGKRVLVREVKEGRRQGGGGSGAMQDGGSAAWPAGTRYTTQNPFTRAWASDAGATATSWQVDEETEARRRHRFYLLKQPTVAGRPRELIPVSATEGLGDALRGRTVLEYPTIYVLPPLPPASGSPSPTTSTTTAPEEARQQPPLPQGHVLGSTERRAPPSRRQPAVVKRKAEPAGDGAWQHARKRQAAVRGAGIPVRTTAGGCGPQRGRGGAGGAAAAAAARGRGRWARGGRTRPAGRRQHGGADQDAEEGEVNSDGDEVMAAAVSRADTSSSNPDSSSDGDEGAVGRDSPWAPSRPPQRGGVDDEDEDDDNDDDDDGPPREEAASTLAPANGTMSTRPRAGLVNYGSDSDGGSLSGGDGGPDADDADLAALRPENPELVAGAIQEIVGLLS